MGMAQRVVSMEAKLLAVFSSGVPLKVTALCRDLEISRQTLYKYRRRFEAEGPADPVRTLSASALLTWAGVRCDRGRYGAAPQGAPPLMRRSDDRLSPRPSRRGVA